MTEIGTTRSARSATPCSARKTPVRIARKRCTSSTAKRGQVNFARADMSTPSTTEVERSRYATIPAERATYQVSAVMPQPRAGRCVAQTSLVETAPSWSTNRPAKPRSSSHEGPASSSSSAALAATSAARQVGAATVTSRQRVLAGEPVAGIDQVVLSLAAPQPGTLRDAARRETPTVERDRVSAREPDDDRIGRRQVAPGRDPAVAEQTRAHRRPSCP